jgi:hypothetical protein
MSRARQATLSFIAWVALQVAPAFATEDLAFAPVQSQRELNFVSVALGLKDRIATLEAKGGAGLRIEYAMIDLDSDGEGEVFIRLVIGDACVREACSTLVFNKVGDRWVKVMETAEPQVTVAKQTHRGYRDVLVGSQPWLWTGKAYEPGR